MKVAEVFSSRIRELNMRRLCLIALAAVGFNTGCSLCCSPFDLEYATYGTRLPRVDQTHGRAGSPFSDPNYSTSPVVAEEIITSDEGIEFDNARPEIIDSETHEPLQL
jgi:hypothetical protein